MRIPRKSALVVLASISIAGLAGASAASFGGVTSGSIGSDSAIVAACDTDGMNVSYTTSFNTTAQRYDITAVNFSGVNPACNGKNATVTLTNNTTGVLNTTNANPIAVPGTSFSVTLGSAVDAAALDNLSLVIIG